MTASRILIIGGTGVFGKRLVRHLAQTDSIALYVASRSAAKAQAFCQTVTGPAPLHPIALDCGKNLQAQLAAISPFAVIDCSGPFQGASYGTAKAVLDSGAHLIDLADARDYLARFSHALDAQAKAQGVTALTGASSTPALSTCVAQTLTEGWQRIDTIDMCITPGGKSEVGRAVIEAILSYAGRDVPVWKDGALASTTGWASTRRVMIPGLGVRRVSKVETFDAEHLGPKLKVHARVTFSAGLESQIEQRGIEALALLRKWGVLGRLNALIPPLLAARKITRLPTSDQGGMMVEISGIDQTGQAAQITWTLLARNNHGPFIPILPAAAALKKLLSGTLTPGARLAPSALGLPDVLAEMQPYQITTQTIKTAPQACETTARADPLTA